MSSRQQSLSHFTSDASGGWGCSAIFRNLWIQLPWLQNWETATIAPKELAPIILAVALWGLQFVGTKVRAQCDNSAVVYAVNKRSARYPTISRLLHIPCLFCALYDITLVAHHLLGIHNTAADSLSLPGFLSVNPNASPVPTISIIHCRNCCSIHTSVPTLSHFSRWPDCIYFLFFFYRGRSYSFHRIWTCNSLFE